jgi:cytoskeleton protein RodZ
MALGNRKPYLVQPDDPSPYAPDGGNQYQGVGAQLRDARLSYGRTTAEFGASLKIKAVHLDALERGDIDGIPGLTYALGYLRSYASALGLDGEAAVVFPAPVQEAKFPTGRVLSLSVVLAVLVYGSYYYLSRSNTFPAETVPAVPAELAEAPPATPPAPVAAAPASPTSAYAAQSSAYSAVAPDAPAAAPAVPPAPAPTPALTVSPGAPAFPGALPSVVAAPPGAAPAPAPADIAPPPATPPAETTAAVVVPAIPGEGRVVLKATDAAWVQIQGSGNEMLFTKILRAGETYVVPARADATLVTGNAGALEIFVDGKSIGPLGAAGQVRRNVPLDPDKLLGGAARPPA